MDPLPQENGTGSTLGQDDDPMNMSCELSPCDPPEKAGGGPLEAHPPPSAAEHMMQDDPLQSPTLVTPLASAFPPMDPSVSCIPYMSNFSIPQPCAAIDNMVVNNDNGLTNNTSLSAEPEHDVEEKKPDKEHKKRSKNWTRPETLKLIKLRTMLAPKFARTGRKSELWDQIASSLQQDQFIRDAQQCRDKWEKLMAGYKEVKDGHKDREDYPFYEELHPLLSGKGTRKENQENITVQQQDTKMNEAGVTVATTITKQSPPSACGMKEHERKGVFVNANGGGDEDDNIGADEMSSHKRKRTLKYVGATDIQAVQTLLESVISYQQKIVKEFIDTWERKEQLREQMRQEREEKWRAEERAQNLIFNNAMILLTQKLVEDRVGGAVVNSPVVGSDPSFQQGPMKRSKNWKRYEVLQLIKHRGEMESKFAKSSRRAALWDELAELLAAQGVKRDGKQCREKWDKLMAEYKDVNDGKKDQSESPYYQELMSALGGRSGEAG